MEGIRAGWNKALWTIYYCCWNETQPRNIIMLLAGPWWRQPNGLEGSRSSRRRRRIMNHHIHKLRPRIGDHGLSRVAKAPKSHRTGIFRVFVSISRERDGVARSSDTSSLSVRETAMRRREDFRNGRATGSRATCLSPGQPSRNSSEIWPISTECWWIHFLLIRWITKPGKNDSYWKGLLIENSCEKASRLIESLQWSNPCSFRARKKKHYMPISLAFPMIARIHWIRNFSDYFYHIKRLGPPR
jgi:hypothetical protein